MALFHRIKKNKDYRKVYRFGRSVADGNMVLFALANKSRFNRFGFTVSKKVGKAVVRNKVRRWFKEACRIHLNEFPESFDYVVLARKAIIDKDYHVVEKSLLKLLKRAVLAKG
jgi:ribonuclease P protein component